jgi:hypothetical protein
LTADSRTDEQRQADDALTAAIDTTIRAYYGRDDEVPLLTDYFVIGCQRGFDEDGDSVTAIVTLSRDGVVPAHTLLGLVEYAGTRLRKVIAEDDDE